MIKVGQAILPAAAFPGGLPDAQGKTKSRLKGGCSQD
jgi:hypothetical protein